MPVLASSAFNTAEDVLTRVRTIINDSEVTGGDVLTDTAPFTFDLLNAGYEQVQSELVTVGVEVALTEAWVLNLPALTSLDPEARLVLDDTGCNIIYPDPANDIIAVTPQLPVDLVQPMRIWERAHGTTNFVGDPMRQPNRGLTDAMQSSYLLEWEWKNDGLRFRGATQALDIKIEYEKNLPKLTAPTDPLPIRGVVNAAAFYAAEIFIASRGGAIVDWAGEKAEEDISRLKMSAARRRQHKQVRRRPYSGGGRSQRLIS